jgi:uncharacterized protein YukE
MTLQASIKAMRDDAALWKGASDTLGEASGAAAQLDLTEQDLSFASVGTGVLTSYQQIQAKAERLLGEGRDVLATLSDRLYEVAAAYEENDAAASTKFDDTWEPRR